MKYTAGTSSGGVYLKKRLFSLLLAASLMTGMLPLSAWAVGTGEQEVRSDDPVAQDPERYSVQRPEPDHAPESGIISVSSAQYKSFLTGKTYQVPSTSKITNGIDVSKWNKEINWKKVKAAGVDFAIIRVGYRGIENGELYPDEVQNGDKNYEKNIRGAVAAGIPVGVYIYSQAITTAEAREEARFCIKRIRGLNVTLPIVFDVEYFDNHSGRLADADLSKAKQTSICLAFADECKSAGYKSMVYANRTMFEDQMNVSEVEKVSQIWLANYTTATSYSRDYDYWQYSATGVVDGISTVVDSNFGFTGALSTAGLRLNQSSVSMAYQNTITLRATKNNISGSVTWSSSRPSVATVSSRGKVTPKKVGITIIKAKAGSHTARCKVTVRPGKTGIQSISYSSGKVRLSWNKKSEAEHYRIYRSASKNGTYRYIGKTSGTSHTDDSVSSGKTYYYRLRAAGYQGSTLIKSAKSDAKSVSTAIPVKKVTLNHDSLKLVCAKSRTLKAAVTPKSASAQAVWKSSSTSIAAVSQSGKVTAKSVGAATVSVSAGAHKASCKVTVVPGTVKLTGVKSTGRRVQLNWKKIHSANYYRVYRASSRNGRYKRIGSTTRLTYTDSDVRSGKTYYYKVCAGKTVGGKKYHGGYSDSRRVTT